MSLPENTVSDEPIIVPFLSPDTIKFNPLVAYERGGVDLQDTSEGLNVYSWRAKLEGSSIFIERPSGVSYEFVTGLSNVVSIDFTFDQNMNPAVTYQIGTNVYLYWFDATPQQYITTITSDVRSPRLTLDDKRSQFNNTSDIIFAYIKNGGDLAYRQQRERYLVERIISSGIPDDLLLEKIGMSSNNRLLFEITPQYLLPLCGGVW